MCGIAGVLDLNDRPCQKADVERMCARLIHRGPDAEGYYSDGPVALGQRRLSIIDLSSGQQPMGNEDGTAWVTFNGEIYNFQHLRPDLEKAGHRFATHSDTEVIVHAYEQYGVACLKHFRGMFAFGLWDGRERSLFLARDRVGKKPLFYTVAAGRFLFASELQALVADPAVLREIDPTAIDDYLTYGYVPAPRTIFKNVYKLPPAHTLTVRAGAGPAGVGTPQRYWDLDYGPKLEIGEREAAEGLLEVLSEAVRLRLIADVPLGALLSGGIDSSLVVALMSRLSGQRVKTFSIGFDRNDFNELPYARLVAEKYGTDHHELIVRPDALAVLPLLVRHYGEPFADSSAVPSYYVSKMTREHVTVALNGDGGDESFAGYERYLGSRLAETYRRVPWLLRRGVIEPLSALIPDALPQRSRIRQVKRFLQVAGRPLAERYLRWITYFDAARKEQLYTPAFYDSLGGRDAAAWLGGELDSVHAAGASGVDALLGLDVRTYLPYDLLVKMDIATMANSLEARSPLLDHEVMEYAARLPSRLKMRGTTLKYLLKRVGHELLPPDVLRRRKMGFGVPVGEWMRNELRPLLEDVLLAPGAAVHDYLRPEALQQLVRTHVAGKQDHAMRLWALLWLELWHREFIRR